MSKKARKSSRKTMMNRSKKRKAASPSVLFQGDVAIPMNRVARRVMDAEQRHAPGNSARQAAQQKRRDRLTAARRKARDQRHETIKAMRS